MEEKAGFFKNLWTSVRDFEKYEQFAADKVSKAILYILILTIIFTSVISLTYTYKFFTIIESTKNYVNENIEEIKLEDGKLEISSNAEDNSQEITITNEDSIVPMIVINTSENVNTDELMEKIKLYDTGLLLLSDRAIISSSLLGQEEEIFYSNLFDTDISSKAEFMDMLSGKNMTYGYVIFAISVFIYMFIIYFTSNLIDGLILGILGYLFARIVRMKLKFKATYNIGLHAITLPILLNLVYIIVNTLTGFTINYFQWMYTTISYIYVAVAILMIKTEIINQKIELIRLEQIQQEQKEEPKEDEEKKEEPKPDKEDEKKEEKKEKKGNQGEQPEGSNA